MSSSLCNNTISLSLSRFQRAHVFVRPAPIARLCLTRLSLSLSFCRECAPSHSLSPLTSTTLVIANTTTTTTTFVFLRAVSLPLAPSVGRSYSRLSVARSPFPFVARSLHSSVPFSRSLTSLSLSLSLLPRSLAPDSSSRSHCYDYLALSSSSPRNVRRPGTWFSRRAMYRRPVRLPLSHNAALPSRQPFHLASRPCPFRDCRASVLFSLLPSAARAGYPIILDSRRSGSTQPLLSLRRALEYRHATDGGGHETRESHATAMTRSVRNVTEW